MLEIRVGLWRPGDRTGSQIGWSCGDQESSWRTFSLKGAARPRQMRSVKANASEPLMKGRKILRRCQNRSVNRTPEGTSAMTCLRPTWHPALRRREHGSGSGMEPWNLSLRWQGKGTSGATARPRVPIRSTGAEQPVVVMKDR